MRKLRTRRLAVGFPFFIHVRNMPCDFRFALSEKGGHLVFGKPNRTPDELDVELNFAVFRFEQHHLVFHIAPACIIFTKQLFAV